MPKRFNVSRTTVNICFVLFAVVLWITSFHFLDAELSSKKGETEKAHLHFYSELLKDFGVVVVGLAVVNMLWSFFGGDPVELYLESQSGRLDELRNVTGHIGEAIGGLRSATTLLKQGQTCGVIDLARGRQHLDMSDFVRSMDKAREQIDLCGITLSSLLKPGEFESNLKIALREKAIVRICIYSPDNASRASEFARISPDTAKAQCDELLSALLAFKDDLRGKESATAGRLQIYALKNGFMTSSIARRDNIMVVQPYVLSATEERTLECPANFVPVENIRNWHERILEWHEARGISRSR